VYVSGLIRPGERKSIEPMADRLASDHHDRLYHFISDGIRDAGLIASASITSKVDRCNASIDTPS
jgi:SRSO17 transposase